MIPRTFGPHRGPDWLGRVAYPHATSQPTSERFVLRLRDPRHRRSLWVNWTLDHTTKASALRVDVLYVDAEKGLSKHRGESWPAHRLLSDPERTGLGIGECQLTQGLSTGLLREENHAISWEASFPAEAAGFPWAPSPRWLAGHHLQHKGALPTVSSVLTAGFIELWGSGRQASCQRIDTQGWLASVTHLWGQDSWRPYAALEARWHEADGPVELNVISFPNRLWKIFGRRSLLGRARVGAESICWVGLRNVFQAEPLDFDAKGWNFSLSSATGQLSGRLTWPEKELKAEVRGMSGSSMTLSEAASIEATLTLPGQSPRQLKSERVSFEASAPSSS